MDSSSSKLETILQICNSIQEKIWKREDLNIEQSHLLSLFTDIIYDTLVEYEETLNDNNESLQTITASLFNIGARSYSNVTFYFTLSLDFKSLKF